ncbi:MAG TPA: CaiB/BaiF CoA-transferase family protein [Vicinamibacterales bacterium]
MPRSLQGVRVLDFTRLLPGAYATLVLADLGADVIKIEDPRGGDGMRTLRTSDSRPYFELLNRNKRSVTLNLRSPESRPVIDALAATADVAIDSFRPSTARRLGVDAFTLRARHPRLVCASISGFGQSGPLAEVAAHDINYQALAGLIRPPALPGPLIADVGAAMQAALAILAALIERQRTGTGSTVDVSIGGAADAWSMFPTTGELQSACYALYETADHEWVALGALEAKFWRAFCERIGRADLIPFQHAAGAEGERVLGEVRAVMRTRTLDDWLAHFSGVDACLTRVAPHAMAGERTSARGAVPTAPALGADTDAVLGAAGFDAAARDALRGSGVI